jgi:hypothetical protein
MSGCPFEFLKTAVMTITDSMIDYSNTSDHHYNRTEITSTRVYKIDK